MTNNRTQPEVSIDDLDSLLRDWHQLHESRARIGRDTLIASLTSASSGAEKRFDSVSRERANDVGRDRSAAVAHTRRTFSFFRPSFRLAASIVIVAILGMLMLPQAAREARAATVNVPDAGRLEARDERGNLLGPCPLTHTEVHVEVSGFFSRVTVRQNFRNPYKSKIEAVYTFPLGHRAAVDRMRMVVDEDRVIVGEVKERQEAREVYDSAREAGHVAALLEQERPNIFTQSVANIEPDVSIVVELSYIETLEMKDGEFSFAFPMTVAPRYIPGYAARANERSERDLSDFRRNLPEGLSFREGLILRGPATFAPASTRTYLYNDDGLLTHEFDVPVFHSENARTVIDRIIRNGVSIQPPPGEWRSAPEQQANFWRMPGLDFYVIYGDGSREFGQIAGDGVAHIAGRWFWFDRRFLNDLEGVQGLVADDSALAKQLVSGGSFAPSTDQVPDAARITPMPVHPSTRAGHDISITVDIDTGGPEITAFQSELHDVVTRTTEPGNEPHRTNFGSSISLALKDESEIPNRDFVLKWRVSDDAINESTFVHANAQKYPEAPGFFTVILSPPDRVEAIDVRPRELIFVLDTSGSMKGEPIAKAKAVMTRAIDSMREHDTFNVITFAGNTDILWTAPRPNTNENRAEALAWVNSREGNGGTEMMKAIDAALNPQPTGFNEHLAAAISLLELANLPADGREVSARINLTDVQPGEAWSKIAHGTLVVRGDLSIRWTAPSWIVGPLLGDFSGAGSDDALIARGIWTTHDGERVLNIREIATPNAAEASRMRICMFLTDGEIGNDMALIDAVKKYARTTRVFSFGIGNSINRYLLANMAHAGRGEVEFVTQESDRDAAVERFVKRIDAPVLTDIELAFSDGLEVSDVLPLSPTGLVPDLYDEKPIILHGRYAQAGKGTLTIRGTTANGRYERTIDLDLPEKSNDHDVIATLWAQSKIDALMNEDLTGVQLQNMNADLKGEIVELGTRFQIMSQFTSFVAVEKSRVTIDGRPMLVNVPIELPSDADWTGFFCDEQGNMRDERLSEATERVQLGLELLSAPVKKHRAMAAAGQAPIVDTRNTTMRAQYKSLEIPKPSHDGYAFRFEENQLALFAGLELATEKAPADQTAVSKAGWDAAGAVSEFSTLGEQLKRDPVRGPKTTTGVMTTPRGWPTLSLQPPVETIDPSRGRSLRLGEPAIVRRLAIDDLHNDNAADKNVQRAGSSLRTVQDQFPRFSQIPLVEEFFESGVPLKIDAGSGSSDGQLRAYGSPHVGLMTVPENADELFGLGFMIDSGRKAVDTHSITQQGGTIWSDENLSRYLLGDLKTVDNASSTEEVVVPDGSSQPSVIAGELDNLRRSDSQLRQRDPGGEITHTEAQEGTRVDGSEAASPHALLAARIMEIAAESKQGPDTPPHAVDASGNRQSESAMLALFDFNDSAVSRFFHERCVILVVTLVEAGYLDAAVVLNQWLIELDDSFVIALDLSNVLRNDSLSIDDRMIQARVLADRAHDQIEDTIRKMVLNARAISRLHEDLRPFITTPMAAFAEAGTPEELEIVVLLDSIGDDVIASLRSTGLRIDDVVVKARFVLGGIDPAALRDLALLPRVRWIERASLVEPID